MQPLSERSDTTENAEREADMILVCDLADDLRDAIIEYQVSTDVEKHMRVGILIQYIGRTAEGDLQAELQIDCELLDSHFGRKLCLNLAFRMLVRHNYTSD